MKNTNKAMCLLYFERHSLAFVQFAQKTQKGGKMTPGMKQRNKSAYTEPTVAVIKLGNMDVITTSGATDDEKPDYSGEWDPL